MSLQIKGIKELTRLLTSRPTQLRSDRNIKIYEYFYSMLLPLVDEDYYVPAVKMLSQIYRNNKVDVDNYLCNITEAIEAFKRDEPADVSEPECHTNEPPTPTHKMVVRKNKVGTKHSDEDGINAIINAVKHLQENQR